MDTLSWPFLAEVLCLYTAANDLSLVQGYHSSVSLVFPLYYQLSFLCLRFFALKHLFYLKKHDTAQSFPLCTTLAFLFTAELLGNDTFPVFCSTLPVLSWTIANHSLSLSPNWHQSFQSHQWPPSVSNSFLVILVNPSAAVDKMYCFVLFKHVFMFKHEHPVPPL